MSLLSNLNNQPQQMTMQDAISKVQRDPVGLLKKRGFNVPNGMTTPEQIIPYLLQTRQLTQQQIMQMGRP